MLEEQEARPTMRSGVLLGLALVLSTSLARAEEPAALGRWRGTYLCNQGWTGVDLEIEADTERESVQGPAEPGRYLRATFSFYQLARNPGVPSGRFTMRGSFSHQDGRLQLQQERWLERPPHYVMVDLSGALDPETGVVTGRIDGYNCGEFELRRAEGAPTGADSWLLGPDQSSGSEEESGR
jgi:hypothetical protein